MKDWIYRNLKEHGNTLISQKTFIKYGGEKKILKDLKNHNLNCHIRKIQSEEFSHFNTLKVKIDYITYYIIEVIHE